MRRLLLLTTLALLLVAGGGLAKEVVTDDAGDQQTTVQGTSQGSPPGDRYGQIDLLKLEIVESAKTVEFIISSGPWPENPVSGLDDVIQAVHFRHGEMMYRLEAVLYMQTGQGTWGFGRLQEFNVQDDRWFTKRWVPLDADPAAGTAAMVIDRDDLVDEDGAAPFPTRMLEDIYVESYVNMGFRNCNVGPASCTPMEVSDLMPNSGYALPFEFEIGLQQTGHARLWTSLPMRASNGEASTFVFTINAKNEAESERIFELETFGAPEGWEISIPDRFVRLAENEVRQLPVIVSTPFAHQHGSAQTFHIHMTDKEDAGSVGKVELGIRYHEIPQPAGHHDTIYFHSQEYQSGTARPAFDNAFSWMDGWNWFNTLSEDPNSDSTNIDGQFYGFGANTDPTWGWWLPLNPSLQMGLDFDLQDNGTITVPFAADVPHLGATVTGGIYHFGRNDDGSWEVVQIAELARSAAFDLLPGETHWQEWEINPLPEADLIVFNQNANMAIQLLFKRTGPGAMDGVEPPQLAPGGHATLPLLEYRDPVPDAFLNQGDLQIEVEPTNPVNPGKTRIIRGAFFNNGERTIDYSMKLEGVNTDWAELLVPSTGTIGSDSQTPISIAVKVPSSAFDGEAADLVVTVVNEADPEVRAVGRFLVEVDTEEDHVDDSLNVDANRVDSTEESPVPIAVAIIAVIGATLWVRRRN